MGDAVVPLPYWLGLGFEPPTKKSAVACVTIRPLGKIMILQGVGHQISSLGVCYANDPPKGGYTTPAPALDLTTSLRGD